VQRHVNHSRQPRTREDVPNRRRLRSAWPEFLLRSKHDVYLQYPDGSLVRKPETSREFTIYDPR
jgi:hypothetical protein